MLGILAGWSVWRSWQHRQFVAVLKDADATFFDPDALELSGATTLQGRAYLVYNWLRNRFMNGRHENVFISFDKPVKSEWLRVHQRSISGYHNLDIVMPAEMIDEAVLDFLSELPNLQALEVRAGQKQTNAPWPADGAFSNLKRIRIHPSGWKPSGLSGISRCPQLKGIELPGELIDEKLIQEICRCPDLHWLHVRSPVEEQMNQLLSMQPMSRFYIEIHIPHITGQSAMVIIGTVVPPSPEDIARIEKALAEAERVPIPSQ